MFLELKRVFFLSIHDDTIRLDTSRKDDTGYILDHVKFKILFGYDA